MGRRFPDEGLLIYRKWVPQKLGDVNKQGSGDSRPIGAQHGNTAANHKDLQSGCGRLCVFAVRLWSNLWDLIWLRTSHYSMQVYLYSSQLPTEICELCIMECFLIKYLQIGNAAINRRDECLCKMKELFTSIRRTMRCVIVLQVITHQRHNYTKGG